MEGALISSGKIFVDESWIYLDLWSVLHFFSGFVLMFAILKYSWLGARLSLGKKFFILFALLVAWEIFEAYLYLNFSFISPESFVDVFWDLVIGMIGGWLYYFLRR